MDGSKVNAYDVLYSETQKCLELAHKLYPVYSFAPAPLISIIDSAKYLGAAYGYEKLEYNLTAYNSNPELYVKEVIPHEVAHIVADFLLQSTNHCKKWKQICKSLGGTNPKSTIDGLIPCEK